MEYMKYLILVAVLFVLIRLVIWIIKTRNHFLELRNSVQEGTSNISNYREQRSTYLRDAIGIAKANYQHEVEGIAQLTSAGQYEQLAALANLYPDLKSSQTYTDALSKVYHCSSEIAASKSIVNGNIRNYNNAIQVFPASIVASMFGFKREQYVDEGNMADNMQVNISEVDYY